MPTPTHIIPMMLPHSLEQPMREGKSRKKAEVNTCHWILMKQKKEGGCFSPGNRLEKRWISVRTCLNEVWKGTRDDGPV